MQGKISRVAAVVRSYNNPQVAQTVASLLDMGVGMVAAVSDKTKDNGVTRAQLQHISDPRLSFNEMSRGYSWANGLNNGLRAIQMTNWDRRKNGKPPFDLLMPLSVEAKLNREHLTSMLDEITDSRQYAMVGSSFCDAAGKVRDLGLSYTLPRNTAAVINLEAFQCGIGGFDPQCDTEGGMEDIDLLISWFAITGKKEGLKLRMLDLRIPLELWRNYDQAEKQKREVAAIEKIFARWLNSYSPDSKEGKRVRYALRELRHQQDQAAIVQ